VKKEKLLSVFFSFLGDWVQTSNQENNKEKEKLSNEKNEEKWRRRRILTGAELGSAERVLLATVSPLVYH
jgi:hypothetical protein